MIDLYKTGIRPLIDDYLSNKEQQTYPDYFRASSAGFCQRYVIMKRLGVPTVPERLEDVSRQTRVFEAGHIFHAWLQSITKDAGLSIAQEFELKDEDLKLVGHFDDLVLVGEPTFEFGEHDPIGGQIVLPNPDHRLILYDYKTANSKAFDYQKDEIGYYHRMQLGTYIYMAREIHPTLEEGRIMQIEKDTLRMREYQLLWTPELEKDIKDYWTGLNAAYMVYKVSGKLPDCTCLEQDGGWFGKRSKYGKVWNDFFFNGSPCSLEWFEQNREVIATNSQKEV